MRYILIRGKSNTGKTTLSLTLARKFKKQGLRPAIIHEDHFRKSLQFKYKAADKQPHINSVDLILTLVQTLVKKDTYDVVILEGLFRYKSMIQRYIDELNPELYYIEKSEQTRKRWNEKRCDSRKKLDEYELEIVEGFLPITDLQM